MKKNTQKSATAGKFTKAATIKQPAPKPETSVREFYKKHGKAMTVLAYE